MIIWLCYTLLAFKTFLKVRNSAQQSCGFYHDVQSSGDPIYAFVPPKTFPEGIQTVLSNYVASDIPSSGNLLQAFFFFKNT